MADHIELGKKGEEWSINHLKKNNYEIIDQNWRYGHLEIDIIAKQFNDLCFVEVKTKFSDDISSPISSVTKSKQKNIIKAANHFVNKYNKFENCDIRFDVISIVLKPFKLEHIENAYYPTI